MLIGLMMLLVPIVIYLATFLFARRLRHGLCRLYRIVGGIIVFGGGTVSFYFAAYTGDQGGIAAFYFQIVVILAYVLFVGLILILNPLIRKKEQKKYEG